MTGEREVEGERERWRERGKNREKQVKQIAMNKEVRASERNLMA